MSTEPLAHKLRVVVIDDTPDFRFLLRLALNRGGYNVVGEAADGSEGIDLVRAERPDVVLLDLSMPVMDGLEALPSIRRLCPKGTIVVLSGFGSTQMSARAVAVGADGYVQKTASLTSILQYVGAVIGGGSMRERPPLSVVPEPRDPSEPEPVLAAMNIDVAAAAGSQVSVWEALTMAPYGILELADDPLFRIVHSNTMAQRLMGDDARPGSPLGLVAPTLARLVAFHRLDADGSFEVELPGGNVRATLRRTGWSVLVYLDSTADDVALLRRAIGTAAHEIRGPVAVISGVVETLGWGGDVMDAAQRENLLASVMRQARMLDGISTDLLTVAQIQRGTLRLDVAPVEPSAVIESAVAQRYEVDDVSIEDDRKVRADPQRLEQILTNLLSNAHKYGEPPYRIRVRGDGDMVSIEVSDEGDGVPTEFLGELFREFARARGTVATGTGLGLFVVRTLAEAQNGTASYRPGPSGGAVFTVSLPAC